MATPEPPSPTPDRDAPASPSQPGKPSLPPPLTPPPSLPPRQPLPTNLPLPPPLTHLPATPPPAPKTVEPEKATKAAEPAKAEVPKAPASVPAPIAPPPTLTPKPTIPATAPAPTPTAKVEPKEKEAPKTEPKPAPQPEAKPAAPAPIVAKAAPTPTPAPPATATPPPAKTQAPLFKEKVPLPLLSRTRKPGQAEGSGNPAASSTTPSSSTSTPAAKPKRRLPRGLVRFLGWSVAILFLSGLGYGAVYYLRQTQVQGLILAPDAVLPEKVAVVRDFSGDIATLRNEFRSARAPFEKDLTDKEANLTRIQSDLAVVEQRKKLFQQNADDANAEIASLLSKARQEADSLWENEGGALEAEYGTRTSDFLQALVARAASLKLTFHPEGVDNPLRSPDVWANAFRLALYNPPPSVKATTELQCLEKQLADWHAFEKTYNDRRTALKAQADQIRKAVSPKLDEIHARVDKATADVAAAETDAAPLRDELATSKVEAEAARTRLSEQRTSYTAQLRDIPKRNFLQSLPVDSRGRFRWQHLENNTQFPPGDYLLWVEIEKENQPYWALVPFTIKEYHRLNLVLKPGAFLPALDMIK